MVYGNTVTVIVAFAEGLTHIVYTGLKYT